MHICMRAFVSLGLGFGRRAGANSEGSGSCFHPTGHVRSEKVAQISFIRFHLMWRPVEFAIGSVGDA